MSDFANTNYGLWENGRTVDTILLPRLHNGSLIGIGFRSYKDKKTGPHIIDKDFWKYAEINWKIPSVKKGKEKYILIRFIEAEDAVKASDNNSDLYPRAEFYQENPGRPHIGRIVCGAYYTLCQKELIKYEFPLSKHVKLIAETAQPFNNGKKPSRAAIYKYVQEEFEWRRKKWLQYNKKIHK